MNFSASFFKYFSPNLGLQINSSVTIFPKFVTTSDLIAVMSIDIPINRMNNFPLTLTSTIPSLRVESGYDMLTLSSVNLLIILHISSIYDLVMCTTFLLNNIVDNPFFLKSS